MNSPLIQKLAEIEAKNKRAHEELCRICKSPASFNMSIPARDDDSDLVIQAGLDGVSQLTSALRLAHVQIESLFDKIKHGDDAHKKWLKEAIDEHFAITQLGLGEGGMG